MRIYNRWPFCYWHTLLIMRIFSHTQKNTFSALYFTHSSKPDNTGLCIHLSACINHSGIYSAFFFAEDIPRVQLTKKIFQDGQSSENNSAASTSQPGYRSFYKWDFPLPTSSDVKCFVRELVSVFPCLIMIETHMSSYTVTDTCDISFLIKFSVHSHLRDCSL